jgi:carbon-monoxide dehydrogenase medium subunit
MGPPTFQRSLLEQAEILKGPVTAMKRFEYFEPNTLDDAISLLNLYGGKANVLAGGTDLLVEIKEHVRAPDYVVNIKKIANVDHLEYDAKTGLRFGALVTAREIEVSPVIREKYPGLCQATSEIGSIQIRNRATIAGNICRASPLADTLPPLIADGASVSIYGMNGERLVVLEEFFTGSGRTILQPDEIVTEVSIPPPPPHTGSVYIKHGRRKAMELATVGVAVSLTLERELCREIRIVLGAVAPTPIRARQAEAVLRNKPFEQRLLEMAAQAAVDESRPISNVRGSAEYRREMVGVLTKRAVARALELAR